MTQPFASQVGTSSCRTYLNHLSLMTFKASPLSSACRPAPDCWVDGDPVDFVLENFFSNVAFGGSKNFARHAEAAFSQGVVRPALCLELDDVGGLLAVGVPQAYVGHLVQEDGQRIVVADEGDEDGLGAELTQAGRALLLRAAHLDLPTPRGAGVHDLPRAHWRYLIGLFHVTPARIGACRGPAWRCR